MSFEKELQDAVDVAVLAHRDVFRKGSNLPYIKHPFDVLSMVQGYGISDLCVWKTCLCHDIIEDCYEVISWDYLVQKIGTTAAMHVRELSFIPPIGCDRPKAKEEYLLSFQDKSIEALVVKFADRCCNTIDFANDVPEYAPKYWKKADALFKVFESRANDIKTMYGPRALDRMKQSKARVEELLSRNLATSA